MRSRPTFWILLCLLCLAGVWLFWSHAGRRLAEQNVPARKTNVATPVAVTPASAAIAAKFFATTNAAAKTNEFAYRLSNTSKSIGELARDQRAILLENALIDTRLPLNFSIPKNLQAADEPGAYIVQAKGTPDGAFRALLARAGAQVISYIPNNAYLVRMGAAGAGLLSASKLTSSVIPYEPYYKLINSTLLGAAVLQKNLPAGAAMTLGLFPDDATATVAQIEKMGGTILAAGNSPFGPMVRVTPPQNWTALAVLSGVQIVEPFHARVNANDLSRQTTGVAANSIAPTNYLNLTGSNVLVQVNDTGVDAAHPDLLGRVFGSVTNDTDGHGTFIAGEIAGSGFESMTITNASGSINPGTNFQYRGKAPLAKLFAMNFTDSDQDLQQGAALTNALISNNSWNFDGDTAYDLEAANYDAATRDSLPYVTGSQGVLYVFSAGNSGGGNDGGGGGGADTILSPATAKDVISVAALESLRNITNTVIKNGTTNAIWKPETDTSYQVAGYSSRGNVGVGTEGTYGRIKPDVAAPGSFIISTRSQQWDQNAYFNPTNGHSTTITDVVESNSLTELPLQFFVYNNAVGVTIQANATDTSVPLPIYVWPGTDPNTDDPVLEGTNFVSLPPSPLNVSWFCAVSNTTGAEITYTLTATVLTTNDLGNQLTVYSNLDASIGPWYRYETGTSMAAADVSGTLALLQDYFTNTLKTLPSPALLKAMLINGARPTSTYNFYPQNPVNWEGWGLINLPNSVPVAPTNSSGTNSVFYLDQSPTNALATGDSHTFLVTVSGAATNKALRVTLAWTDPAGNPAAAIKLVNNLDLIVTSTNSAATNIYYGNDIPSGSIYNSAGNTNAPNLDTINNLENVFLQAPVAGSYSVTVVGRGVNVNAVTAQSNNIVQDYALVISSGDGLTPGAITVTDGGTVSNPTGDQLITDVVATNSPLFNQFVGANSPLLGTNTVAAGGNTTYISNAIVTVGQTNQWHFYVVTNTYAITNANFTNAAFITFLPPTLSIPRMGVFADSDANSTTPEADIDMYVATGTGASNLINLDPIVLSNCVQGVNGDAASLSRGGTEFVAYNNSSANQIYYIGIKSETQMASEYAFLPVFTQTPFSQLNPDGSQTVNGVPLPVNIPDGNPAHPGVGYVFGLALYPMAVQSVTVSNQITHQNIGDLIGVLTHDLQTDVLNNHDSLFNPSSIYNFFYDDSSFPATGSQPSDGPGSLNNFVGQQAAGVWQLTEVDDSQSQTGAVTGFTLNIVPHIDPSKGVQTQVLAPGEFYTTYVDVPLAATNLTIFATNITTSSPLIQPVQLFVRYNQPPTQSNYDATTPVNPTGFISIGATNQPPLRPGRYFFSFFNPNVNPAQTVQFFAKIDVSASGPTYLNFDSSGPTPLPDDAVTTSSITVTNTDPIAALNVGIRVDHPRISDLVFHLISPDGTRYSLMENRGGTTTNGAGISLVVTNTSTVPHAGNADAYTNTIDTGMTSGTITLNYDVFELPDTIDVFYQGTNLFHFDPPYTGNDIRGITNIAYGPGSSTFVTIIVNAGGNTNYPTTAWTYSVTSTLQKYLYLDFTEDTNLTTTPIKFAPPPFVPVWITNTTIQTNITATTNVAMVSLSSFDSVSAGDYTSAVDGWIVASNQVSVVNDAANANSGSNFLALANGSISQTLPTIAGQTNTLTYAYRGPGMVSMWRAEGNANDAVGANNGTLVNGATCVPGMVGKAFKFSTINDAVTSLTSGFPVGTSDRTMDCWVLLNSLLANPNEAFFSGYGTFGSGGQTYHMGAFWDARLFFSQWGGSIQTVPAVLSTNQWYHVAITSVGTNFTLYLDGTNMTSGGLLPFNTPAGTTFNIGAVTATGATRQTLGLIDEVGVYNRALSASEIRAFYTAGSAGKYDTNSSFPQNLAKANLTLGGVATNVFFGANTNWQTNSITFTATTTGTSLQISGLEPGMLMDSFTLSGFASVTNYVTNTVAVISNLYYFPEQSIDPLVGTSPTGTWQLEVQDDRVGAYDTNNPPSLVNWELQMVLASTNSSTPPVLTNAPPEGTNIDELTTLVVTNNATDPNPALTLTYALAISIDTNAMTALGWPLTYATTNPPPSIDANGVITWTPSEAQGPGVYTITTTVTDNNSPPLSATNSFSVTVNEVNTPPFWPTNVPSQTNYTVLDLNTLTVTNTATDSDIPTNTLTYKFLSAPAGAVINTNTGIITWAPTLAQQTTTNIFATVVTDTNLYALTNQSLSNTNFFTVTVLPPLSLTNDVPSTNSSGIGAGSILWYLVRVPTNADIATNILLFADAPLNIWFSTNSPPTITTTNDFVLIPNATNGSSILTTVSTPTNIVDQGLYYLGVQNPNSFTVTNYALEVDFHLVIPGIPFSATLPAKAVTGTNALLNGFATPSGLPAMAWFQWGPTTNYGALTPPVNVFGGFGVVYVTNFISNLAPGQTYHYRLVTSNSVAVKNGFDQIFGEGNVVAWGAGASGQTNVPAGLNNVVAVAGGGSFSLGLKSDGTVAAWGDGVNGDTNVPVGLSNVVEIAAGAYHGVALKNDGTVVVWGETTYGDTNVPVGLSNVVMVAAGSGGHHTLALKSDGTVVAWGAGLTNSGTFPNYGQSIVPAGLSNIVAVAGGGSHSLALRNDGTVVAWGAGLTNNPANGFDYGQSIVPAGLTNAVAVAGGEFHSLALKNDETVLAWGAGTNYTGVNPTNGQSSVPAGLTNAVVVSGGEFHSLALKNDGTMIAWGDNSSGQTNIPASFTNVIGISAGAYHNLALKSLLFNAVTNFAPFWPSNPPAQTVNELALLTVTNTAIDTNSPPDALTYSVSISVNYALMLTNNWPTNYAGTTPLPVISTNGIITWTPSELQGPGVYTITTIVTDTNIFVTTNQSLSATNTFTVTVNETNSAPFWPTTNPPPQTVNELTLLTVTNTATDTDVPSNTLTYTVSISVSNSATLANGWPTNFVGTNPPPIINPTNGIVTWTPSETQGPGVYTITTIVTDTNLYALTNNSLSATNSFSVTVNEVNSAPFFTNTLPTNTIAILTTLTVTNTAVDTDSPPNTLSYRLLNPPAGSSFDTNAGIFNWTPPAIFANTTNIFTNVVTDYNPYDPVIARQHLSATNPIVVIVLPPPYAFTLAATAVTGPNAQMNGFATPNGAPTSAWFQWGTSRTYGTTTPAVPAGSGRGVIYVTNALFGLTLGQVYHYRLVASNSLAVTYGFDQIFDVGGITAWGNNGTGQTNVPPVLTNTAVAISGGFNDSLALRNNARPLGWGLNSSGQTNIPPSLTNAVAIASGGDFNLALRNTGRVVAWGYNLDGETNVPATLSNVVAIAGGGYHSLALRTNGTIVAWGYNGAGETNVPVGLSNVVAVAAGIYHSVALKNDGTVIAWGFNADGETNVPVGLNTVVAIAADEYFSLALKTNGTVVGWGLNDHGQISIPAGLSNVVAIAAGGFHSLALKGDGTVVAWGAGMTNNPPSGVDYGQSIIPSGLTNVAAVAGGGYHSLALVATTSVNPNTAPSFLIPNPTNHFINVGATLTVTNTAVDSDIPAQILTYILSTALANASIDSASGIITFSPAAAQGGTTNVITTVVTDNGVPNLSATNLFTVFVNPVPFVGSVSFTTNALTLQWSGWTNEQFNVQWTTNLAPPINWTTFPNLITSTTGTFSFTDTNAPFAAKFYQLILLP